MIDPKCLKGNTCYGHDQRGYLLPCCWTQNEFREKYISQLTQEKFHFSNVNSIEEIVNSPEWTEFYRVLLEEPENAPKVCKNYCAKGQVDKYDVSNKETYYN